MSPSYRIDQLFQRPAQGVHIMDVSAGDAVVALAIATDRRDPSSISAESAQDEDDILADVSPAEEIAEEEEYEEELMDSEDFDI